MEFEFDDPRLTAYALGELNSSEAAEVEAFLSRNPAARFEVEQIRSAAGFLGEELQQEVALTAGLSADAKLAIAEALTADETDPVDANEDAPVAASWNQRRRLWHSRPAWATAAAAILIGAFFVVNRGVPPTAVPEPENETNLTFTITPRMSDPKLGDDVDRPNVSSIPGVPSDGVVVPPISPHGGEFANRDGVTPTDDDRPTVPNEPGPSMAVTKGHTEPPPRNPRPPTASAPMKPTAVTAPRIPIADAPDPATIEPLDFVPDASYRTTDGEDARSTFSVEVGGSGFVEVRDRLTEGFLPNPAAVRIEEMVNFLSWNLPNADGERALSVTLEVGQCPWDLKHRLAFVGIKGRQVPWKGVRQRANLVFVVDLSRSMGESGKLALVRRALGDVIAHLTDNDRVAIVAATNGGSHVVAPSIFCRKSDAAKLRDAVNALVASSSARKSGGDALELAYAAATENLVSNGTNRVVLITDAAFESDRQAEPAWADVVIGKARPGVQFTVMTVGQNRTGRDAMKALATRVEGTSGVLADERDAGRSLADQIGSRLFVVARDVRLQVEFNPNMVASYRLVGYTNRRVSDGAARDDRGPIGQLGSGDDVVALYEIIPSTSPNVARPDGKSPLRYQPDRAAKDRSHSNDVLTVTVRYQKPNESRTAPPVEASASDAGRDVSQTSSDFRLASAIAMFGLELCGLRESTAPPWDTLEKLVREGATGDLTGPRAEVLRMIQQARRLRGQ